MRSIFEEYFFCNLTLGRGLFEALYTLAKVSFKEVSRHLICPAEGLYGVQIPAGVWHTIHVIEPSVIFEAKDGKFLG